MWISVKAETPFDACDWVNLGSPNWEYRLKGSDEWVKTVCGVNCPLHIETEVAELPERVVVRVMGPDGLVYLNSAIVEDVTHLYRKRPPADNPGRVGETSITVNVPKVPAGELRDASIPMRWLLGKPVPHFPGGIRWMETQLPACREAQLLLRVPEENPVAYLALPGERLAIKIMLPGLPAETAVLSAVALPFAAEVR